VSGEGPVSAEEIEDLLRDTSGYLAHHRALSDRWGTAPPSALAAGDSRARAGRSPATPAASRPAAAAAAERAGAAVAVPPERAGDTLDAIRADLGDCRRCRLCEARTHIVFGAGREPADLVFVGEGPGYHEDQRGEPFVGVAGELLDRILENVLRLRRDDVYICNVVKCRPPENRNPEPDEVAACAPFLARQIAALRPKVVVPLGKFAAQSMLRSDAPISRLRGRVHDGPGYAIVPTFHPAYLLRNPGDKKLTMEDMLRVRSEYEARTGTALPPVMRGRARAEEVP
jgi:DNA polymerase